MKHPFTLLLLFIYSIGFSQSNELRPYSLVENIFNIEQTNVYTTAALAVDKKTQ